jgi:phage gpG-like protein
MAEIVAGTRELSDFIQQLLKLVDGKDLTDCLMAGGLVVERRMKENITKQGLIDTGNLRASVSAEPEGARSVTIGPRNVIYAAIHEFGGIISAVKAPALRFRTKDGAWHTVQSVTIPARPYARPALDEHMQEVEDAIAAAIRKKIGAITG